MSANNQSSVPSNNTPSIKSGESFPTKGNNSTKHFDSILMYCSFFTYGPNQAKNRQNACNIKIDSITKKI